MRFNAGMQRIVGTDGQLLHLAIGCGAIIGFVVLMVYLDNN